MDARLIILILKIAVAAVTVLLIGSLIALATGRVKLHGRINIVFFSLTLTAVVGLEVVTHIIYPGMLQDFLRDEGKLGILYVHLAFSAPSAFLLFVMLFTGLKHHRKLHIATGIVFSLFWTGTFITGIFFL